MSKVELTEYLNSLKIKIKPEIKKKVIIVNLREKIKSDYKKRVKTKKADFFTISFQLFIKKMISNKKYAIIFKKLIHI